MVRLWMILLSPNTSRMNVNLRHARLSVTFLQVAALITLLTLGCDRVDGRRGDESRSPTNDASGDGGKAEPAFGASQARIRSVVLDAREEFGDSTLETLSDLGATHLSLVSFGFQQDASAPEIRFRPDVRWYSESESGARSVAVRARAHGLGVILKPQIWLQGGAWTADIDFAREADWTIWESQYREYLMHTARLAEAIGAELLIVGTELANPVRTREEFWRRLIADIRTVYDGKLTYGANWHDDFENVPFWDALDYIGVQAYFPIAQHRSPSTAEMVNGWRPHVESLEEVSRRESLPVLFTEIGYRSISYAAAEPWRWPAREENATVDPDYEIQSDLFEAFFETIWTKPWFAGAIIWKMYPDGGRPNRRALDFTPQDKPAEDVIRHYFRATPGTRHPSDGRARDLVNPDGG